MHTDMRGRGTFGSLKGQGNEVRTSAWKSTSLLDCSRETLVALRVVVLETHLKLDRLHEISFLLAIGVGKEFLDRAPHA